jgi:hypothetical protein
VNCPPTPLTPGGWFNPGSGACQNSIGQLLTFTFTNGPTLPSQVIWTVAFNTTHEGYAPIGESTACFISAGGCGYDSLNVGVLSFGGAPYIGTDVNEDIGYSSVGGRSAPLTAETGYTGFRPLGEIRIN